jgi:hypothetical protein
MEYKEYDLFKKGLKNETKKLYLDFIDTENKDNICGFSLYSDESAMSVSAAINIYSHFNEIIKEESGYDSYFRFSPNEWKYDFIESKGMDDLSTFLQKGLFSTPKQQFIEHRNKIYSIIVDVLEELKNEKIFDGLKDDFVLMFSITDFSDMELEFPFIRRLNSEEIVREFEKWKMEEADDDDDETDDYDFDDNWEDE